MPISNENLLINGGFKINPRGQSSYSTNSTSIVRTVAMWRIQAGTGNSNVTVTVNGDGTLTVTNNTSAMGYFVQAFHEPFEEGDYTASMNLLSKTGPISFAINDCMEAAQEISNGFNAFTGNGSPSRVTFYLGAGSSMRIQYCKLEHGNIATAYFEEDEAIAQMRCEKYVLKLPTSYSGYTGSTSYIYFVSEKLMGMASTPSVDVIPTTIRCVFEGGVTPYNISNITVNKASGEINVQVTSPPSSLASKSIGGWFDKNIILSCEP